MERWLGVKVLDWWRSGCPEGLSLRSWAMGLAAWLLTAIAIANATSRNSLVEWVLFALAGYLTAGILMIVLSPMTRRLTGATRTCAVLFVWALAGAAAVSMLITLADIAMVEHRNPSPGILLTGVLFTLAWFPIGGRFAYALSLDKSTRGDLLRQLARERALALESARLVESDRIRLIDITSRVVSKQLHKAREFSADPATAAAALQNVVDEVVRPLSHELARGEVQEQTLVEAVHTMGAVSPRPLSDFLQALRRPSPLLIATTALRPIIILLIVLALIEWRMPPIGSWIAVSLAAIYSFAETSAYVLASARTTSSLSELSLAVDAAEWASARLRQLAWSERERLGKSIHGEAQARIVATALSIQLGKSGDIEQQVAMLSNDIHELLTAESSDSDWRSIWSRIIQVWDYSVEIVEFIDESTGLQLDSDPVAAHAVVSVLREAATNAVRHGHARCLDVSLTTDNRGFVCLTLVDDGYAGTTLGPPGMGSRTMDAACFDWELRDTAFGHRLDARFPTVEETVHG